MWNRVDLKERGKAALRSNRITCIFAAFLLSVAAGSDGVSFMFTALYGDTSKTSDAAITAAGTLSIFIFLIGVFIFAPVEVGIRKFFLDNSKYRNAGFSRYNLGVGFTDGNYTNVVAGMFMTNLLIVLWSLLFFIPGFIKAYSWRLVPYIIAENPEISGRDARAISERMMYGSRMEAFILDISFFGWAFIGALTAEIGNIIWTIPYKATTDAELYLFLKNSAVQAEYVQFTVE